MGAFSSQFRGSEVADRRNRFSRLVRSRLLFEELRDREESIHLAHEETLNWVFRSSLAKGGEIVDFPKWLEGGDGSNVYWITGKPGSGKSTLMKHVDRDPRTSQHLRQWCPDKELLVRASFFFWNPGSNIQKSREGLLRSLIYQIVLDNPNVIPEAFKERWELYDAHGGGLRPLRWEELRRGFTRIISNARRRFFFLVDGLDEFDGDHKQLNELVLEAAKLKHVKMCVSSRPWLVFEDCFEDKPSLRMELLTEDDIKTYVSSLFLQNRHYLRLHRWQRQDADALLSGIVRKSMGVFLWVYLVVDSLLTGLSNSDRLADLQQRLDALPSELSELFDRLLNNLEPIYYRHACQLILVVEAFKGYREIDVERSWRTGQLPYIEASELPLLLLSFADEEDLDSVIGARLHGLSSGVRTHREEEMRRRLNSRCRGLFEKGTTGGTQCVSYLHRTAREYVKTPDVWEKLVSAAGDTFDPNLRLCVGSLMGAEVREPHKPYNAMQHSLYHAALIESKSGAFFVRYLDELATLFPHSWPGLLGHKYQTTDVACSMLEYAVAAQGGSYHGFGTYGDHVARFGPILEIYAYAKVQDMAPLENPTALKLLSLNTSDEVALAIRAASPYLGETLGSSSWTRRVFR